MGNIAELRQQISEVNDKLLAIVEGIKSQINHLPDNPKAIRIAPNVVIVNNFDLLDNWTPEFYNFKWQYQSVCNYISNDKCTADQLIKRLEKVISSGKVPYEWGYGAELAPYFNWQKEAKLHPDVVRHLKDLLY